MNDFWVIDLNGAQEVAPLNSQGLQTQGVRLHPPFLPGDEADIARGLLALRGNAPSSDRVFPISERRINQLINKAVKEANKQITKGGQDDRYQRSGLGALVSARPRLARD